MTVLGLALEALPARARPRPDDPDSPRVLARSDSAGATHMFAAACRKRGMQFSFGFPVDERIQRIVGLIPDECWHHAIEDDGQASHRASGVRPVRRHQPRAMVVVAGSLMVENVRSAPVRQA